MNHYDDLSYSLCLINKGATDSTILQNGWAVICVARLISLSPLVFFFLIITPLAELIPTLHKWFAPLLKMPFITKLSGWRSGLRSDVGSVLIGGNTLDKRSTKVLQKDRVEEEGWWCESVYSGEEDEGVREILQVCQDKWDPLSLITCLLWIWGNSCFELNCNIQHDTAWVFSTGQSESQLSDSCDATDQATAAEQSQDVKIYIPYESAELCITQVQKKSIIAGKLLLKNIISLHYKTHKIVSILYTNRVRADKITFILSYETVKCEYFLAWLKAVSSCLLPEHADTQCSHCQTQCCVLTCAHMATVMQPLWPLKAFDHHMLLETCFLCSLWYALCR